MAFGALLRSGTAAATSGVSPTTVTLTAITVAAGDLVFVAAGQLTTLEMTAATDNLGNTYSSAGTAGDAGSATVAGFYTIVSVPGSLTSVTVTGKATNLNDHAVVVCVYQGPFLAADKLIATITDSASPFACPSSTTLSQADELVIGYGAGSATTSFGALSASSPVGFVVDAQAAFAAAASVRTAVGSVVVSATTAVVPTFTGTATGTVNARWGTATFKKDPATQIFTPTVSPLTGSADTSYSGFTAREIIPASLLTDGSYGTIQIGWVGIGSGCTILMRVGLAATNGETSPDFASSPTVITWGGGFTGLDITPGTEYLSDVVNFAFDGTKDLVISIEFSAGAVGGPVFEATTTGIVNYYLSGADGSTVTTSGYTNYGQKNFVTRIKTTPSVAINTNITVPQGNLALSPTAPLLPNKIITVPQGNLVFSPTAGVVSNRNMFVAFNRNLTAVFPHAEGWTMRQRIEAANLVDILGKLQVSLKFGALSNGSILAAYVGHAAVSGDLYDFDGSQQQLTFSGSATPSIVGAVTLLSDALTTFVYDYTKPLIISVAFGGTRVDLAAYGG